MQSIYNMNNAINKMPMSKISIQNTRSNCTVNFTQSFYSIFIPKFYSVFPDEPPILLWSTTENDRGQNHLTGSEIKTNEYTNMFQIKLFTDLLFVS